MLFELIENQNSLELITNNLFIYLFIYKSTGITYGKLT